jgi:hypothetical protein
MHKCATAQKNRERGTNAQDCTLRTLPQRRVWLRPAFFCGAQGNGEAERGDGYMPDRL